jgi:uncharacterized membrane protein (DUF4010 family)
MIAMFLLVAIVTFIALAFLFYFTAMSSSEDHRRLFVRVYLAMLVVFALGTYMLSPNTAAPASKMVNAQLGGELNPSVVKGDNHV